MTEHKEVCLSINGTQSVRLEKETTEFKKYFKQLPVPFKVYADFQSNLKSVESYEGSYLKKYQDHIPHSFACKLVYVDDKFSKLIVVFRGENATLNFIKAILKQYEYCKKVMKKKINKKKKNAFQSSNTCLICEKLIDDDLFIYLFIYSLF